MVNISYRDVSLPKYLSGISSGIRTSIKRNQLAGKYVNENSIAIEYVNVVTIIRLPDLLTIKLRVTVVLLIAETDLILI